MRRINQCLNKQLAAICQGSVQLEELSLKIKQLLPEALAASCTVGSFNKGCLVLSTVNAAWASQLRYAVPELRDALRKEGMYQLLSIKIIISENGHLVPQKNQALQTPELSEKTKALILKESQICTYQPLKNALQNLGS